MDQATKEMARDCYGYGRWDAPFWFIGPEQGQGNPDDIPERYTAFSELNDEGLCDCREFHKTIEPKWHRETPALQPTWRRLMLVLMACKGALTGDKDRDATILRNYQRDQWGTTSGETCVIELSGLPARNLSERRDRESFRQQRIEKMCQKMSERKPGFVLIYSNGQWDHWKQRTELRSHNVEFAPSPTAPGYTDQYWIDIGKKLRDSAGQ
ncbi:MAG: hypothetical protein JST61_02800 [Acidobacteria bacterium]|nr:hypothetical protein [Acidobacteriota bacterium]